MGVVHSILAIIVEFITGSLGNGFIALVNCKDWVKRRKISLVDQILTALAISQIVMLWSFVISVFVFLPFSGLWVPPRMFKMIIVLCTIASHLSICLATCLSIFYFLKVANFSNSIFLYLKWRVKNVISVALFVCLLLLILNILLMKIYTYDLTDRYKTNMSYSSSSRNFAQISKLLIWIYAASISIPFILSLVAFLLLVFSLWKHHTRMQYNASRCRGASTVAHIKALQTVIDFLMLYTIFFLSFLLQIWKNELLEKKLTLFCQVATEFIPSCHPFVLILGNCKLRQASRLVLRWLRFRSKDAEF